MATRQLHLVCVVTDNYLDRARAFLRSLLVIRTARCHCVCHGFKPSGRLVELYPWVEFHFMPFAPSQSHGMIQHGRFLDALPQFGGDELVVLSDADVLVQRDFRPEELARFHAYDMSTMGLGRNSHDTDTLAEEKQRIGILGDEVNPYQGLELGQIPVYNCGVMVGRVALFRRLQSEYETDCFEFYGRCGHRSRCQFHICLALHRLSVVVDRLGGELHTHGHFGFPPGAELRHEPEVRREQVLYWRGSLVMFRHAI